MNLRTLSTFPPILTNRKPAKNTDYRKIQSLNLKVWVFKKTITPRPTSENPNAKVVRPVKVIDGVEVYPTPSKLNTGFFIEWNEISSQPIPGYHNFYVAINQLYQLAYKADTKKASKCALESDDDIDLDLLTQSTTSKELSPLSLSDSDSGDPNDENYKSS